MSENKTPRTMRCWRDGKWHTDELANLSAKLEQELQSAQATIHELQFGKYGTQHLGERIRTLEAEKLSAQKSEQDCRQIITTYCEEIDGQRLQISQLQAENGKLREALKSQLEEWKLEIVRLHYLKEAGGPREDNVKKHIAEIEQALSTKPAGDTFVPLLLAQQLESFTDHDLVCSVPEGLCDCGLNNARQKLQSYAPTSEVKL